MSEPILIRRSTHLVHVWPTYRDAPAEPPPPTGPQLIDSCTEQNDIGSYGITDTMKGVYQGFTLDGPTQITSAEVSLHNPVGAFVQLLMRLYNASGEAPALIPQGSHLASSTQKAGSAIFNDPAGQLYDFRFMLPVIGPGKFCLTLETSTGGGTVAPEKILVGFNFDFTGAGGAAHSGNGGYKNQLGQWTPDDMADMIFNLYGVPQ